MKWFFPPSPELWPLYRRSTLTIAYDSKYNGTEIGRKLFEIQDEINLWLGSDILAIAFVPKDKVVCDTGDGVSEICLFVDRGEYEALGSCYFDSESIMENMLFENFVIEKGWYENYYPDLISDNGGVYAVPSANMEYKVGEIKEADIIMSKEAKGDFLYIGIKHELLHGLGFAHVNTGIMRWNAKVKDDFLEEKQLESWKEQVASKGGFVNVAPVIPIEVYKEIKTKHPGEVGYEQADYFWD